MAKTKLPSLRRTREGHVELRFIPGYDYSREGTICENPDDPVEERIYCRTFTKKPIFFDDEYDLALDTHIRGQNVIVISMNGYSSLKPAWLEKYGIREGEYEAACAALLCNTINHVQAKFQAAQIRVIHGASDMGVDLVIERVAKDEFGLTALGFSCPEFMPYVPDDSTPVYVAKDKDEYADSYIRSLDLLLTTGGRMHALQHDTLAACVYDKRVHFVDIPNMLSSVTVPARIIEGKKIIVENAAAAFGRNISFADCRKILADVPSGGDKWDGLFAQVGGVATEVARSIMTPQHMFKTRS